MPTSDQSIRIVSLQPAATDTLVALGAAGNIAGISHLCTAPPGRDDIPRVLTSMIDSDTLGMAEINAEVRRRIKTKEPLYILDERRTSALEPTLVISQGLCPVCAATPDTVSTCDTAGKAKLLVLSPHTLEDVESDFREIGLAIGREREAAALAQEFRRRIETIRAATTSKPRPRVVVIEWFEPLWISGEWIIDMVQAAGGEYVGLSRGESSRAITCDELVSLDPELIIAAPCSMSIERAKRELPLLLERPEWQTLRAVRDRRVALMDGAAHFSAPGPRLAEGVEYLAEVVDVLMGRAEPTEKVEPWFQRI